MRKKKNVNDAVEILHRKFIKDKPERISSLETERVNAEVAKIIHDLRKDAGFSQKELAALIGTTQSAISRLEDADYEGHSLSMLHRIAKALNHRLTVFMMPGIRRERHSIRFSRDHQKAQTVTWSHRQATRPYSRAGTGADGRCFTN